ncbi:MAG TPA: hypothetical protein VF444_07320 [Pseudonocardiaceae bacterium]
MSGFTVNTTALAQAGREISGYGDEVQALQGQLGKAEVPQQSWGLLGDGLGLYDIYVGMLTDLRDGLLQMGVHLNTAGGLFGTMQEEYDNRDREIAAVLNGIGSDAATGASIGWNIAGATVGGTVGGAVGTAVGAASAMAPDGSKVLGSVPLAGNVYKTFQDGAKAIKGLDDGDIAGTASAVSNVAADVTGFASDAVGAVGDPLNFLITKGLSFLENLFTPLKEMLEAVTGDPKALTDSATGFNGLAKSVNELSSQFEMTTQTYTQDWSGDAAFAAGQTMNATKQTMDSTADSAGHIAGLLQISSMLMKAAYDIINGIIADVVEQVVITVLAAQASAVVTLGASEVAGTTAAVGEIVTGVEKAGAQTQKAASLLQKIMSILKKIQDVLKKLKDPKYLKNSALQKFVGEGTKRGKMLGATEKKVPGEKSELVFEKLDEAKDAVTKRTGADATTGQAAKEMLWNTNWKEKITNSAHDRLQAEFGLAKPGDTDNIYKQANTYAKNLSNGISNVNSLNKAQDYMENPGGSSASKEDEGNKEGSEQR